MKTIKTDPGAKRLMESLRNMGYDCSTAIADLVDNSIASDASEIFIDIITKQETRMDHIPKLEYHQAAIVIADNGNGMDKEQLHEAMRFGTLQEYSLSDLGKYGLGLKTASLSQCRVLTVASKAKAANETRPRRHTMRWDVDHVYETNEWDLLMPEDDELEPAEKELLDQSVTREHGTVVLWTNFEGALSILSSNNRHEREKFLANLMDDISAHLRMVFHRFMQGTVMGRKKLTINLCGTALTPWDPFCRDEKTYEPDILRLPVVSVAPDDSKIEETVTVSPFILPRADEFSSQDAWKEASGPRNWNLQQGFYFYRNNRLLQAGGWSRLRTSDEHTKLLRVAVDFPGELDRAFAINITKMRASIPAEIRDKVDSSVTAWAKTAKARYNSPSSSKEDYGGIVSTGVSRSDPAISFPSSNGPDTNNVPSFPADKEVLKIFETGNSWELRKFCDAIIEVLEAVSAEEITADEIPISIIKKIRDEL